MSEMKGWLSGKDRLGPLDTSENVVRTVNNVKDNTQNNDGEAQ